MPTAEQRTDLPSPQNVPPTLESQSSPLHLDTHTHTHTHNITSKLGRQFHLVTEEMGCISQISGVKIHVLGVTSFQGLKCSGGLISGVKIHVLGVTSFQGLKCSSGLISGVKIHVLGVTSFQGLKCSGIFLCTELVPFFVFPNKMRMSLAEGSSKLVTITHSGPFDSRPSIA